MRHFWLLPLLVAVLLSSRVDNPVTEAATAVFQWVADMTPALPGVAPGIERAKAILASDIDYPPYCFLGDASTGFLIDGFVPSVAKGLEEVCDIDIFIGQTKWEDCWDNNQISMGLRSGWYHGCVAYTWTVGARNRYLEFSKPVLDDNAPAGIISRLDPNGQPVVSGLSNLNGVRVVDVVGWAPTADTLALVTNNCTGETMAGYQIIEPTQDGGTPNDAALKTLLAGDADALWIFSDQAEKYKCENTPEGSHYDCRLWDRLGKDFAYIQTGIKETQIAGTSLAIAKLGSGLNQILDPCLEKFLETESYYNLCEKFGLTDLCFRNRFFPNSSESKQTPPWSLRTSQLLTSCSDGYCSCPSPSDEVSKASQHLRIQEYP